MKILKNLLLGFILCVLSASVVESQETPIRAFGITERKVFADTNGVPYSVNVLKSGLTNVKLKKSNGADSVSGVESSTPGVYVFDFAGHSNIGSHYWQLYIDYTVKPEFGKIQMGTALMTDGTLPMQGQLDMNNFRIFNLGSPVSGIDAVNLSYLQANYKATTAADTFYVTRHTTQSINGSKTFTGTLYSFTGGEVRTSTATQLNILVHSDGSNYPKIVTSSSPSLSNHIATKGYVDDQVSSIVVTPYQESVNMVRLMPGQTIQTNQTYSTYTNAANSFSSPLITKQCQIFIPGTGAVTQYIEVPTNALRNYVHTIGAGKHINLIVGTWNGGAASVTKTTTFENSTLWFGANDIAGDRTWNGTTFKDCIIYAYRNVTFTNCNLINVEIRQNSSYDVHISGSTEVENCNFYQTLIIDSPGDFNGIVTNSSDNVRVTYTMPTDPSNSGSEE